MNQPLHTVYATHIMSQIVSNILAALKSDPIVAERTAWLDAGEIPIDATRKRFYLLVNFVCAEGLARPESAIETVSRVVQVIIGGDFVRGYAALEIVPCVGGQGSIERIFRLSIESTAYARAALGLSSELRHEFPFPGATCGWYQEE